MSRTSSLRAGPSRSGTRKRTLKAKKSYTLSQDSVEFLESLCKKRKAPSVSSVLEAILQTARRAQGRATLEGAISDYYDSLSHEEAEELAQWGEFALAEFPSRGA